MIWNYLSPIKTSNPYDQLTHTINHNSYVNESLNLRGALYLKNNLNQIQKLSEDCTIYMLINNEKIFEYTLNIKNNTKCHWDIIQFLLNSECKIFKFINNLGNKCIMLYKNSTFYIFELFNNDNNEEIFFEKLSILIFSSNMNISINETIKEKEKNEVIINLGEINELNNFLNNYFNSKENKDNDGISNSYSKIYNNRYNYINYNNRYINKNEFMNNFDIYKDIYTCKGESFIYDKYIEEVIPIEDKNYQNNISFLKINKIGYNSYILVLELNDKIIAFTKIENNIDISINDNLGSISFISQNINSRDESAAYTFIFEDKSKNEINFIKNLLIRCLYEKNNYEEDFSQIQNISSFNYDIDYNNIDIDKYSFLSSGSKIYEIGDYFLTRNINSNENTKNKLILQSYNNRTFVLKENNQIDVFKTNFEENELINITSISPIKIKNEFNENSYKDINISNGKMFNNDNEILFQDSKNKNTIYQYDINKQSIIQEWDCDVKNNFMIDHSNININNNLIDITYPKKLGQLDEKNEMIGINSNNIFLLDKRVNRKNKIVDIKNYSTNPDFKSIITTGFGGIAVGSENGDMRLFKEIGNSSKTLLTGFGHSINYLDSTIDGKYILATCDKYIMVINTGNEYNFNGFINCLGRIKQKPLMLYISDNDLIKYKINNEIFTPAKFNNNTNCNEIMIISSLGQYIILWNFKQVLNGETNLYKIINVNESVIGYTTKFDKNQLIIALHDKLRLQNEEIIKN